MTFSRTGCCKAFLPAVGCAFLFCGACKQQNSSETGKGSGESTSDTATLQLVLVEAELATRMQHGDLTADEFCEQQVPILEFVGNVVDVNCGRERHRLVFGEETRVGDTRTLRSKDGLEMKLEAMGRMRYRVTGNPCDQSPRFYVEYAEAKSFREQWLKTANCPTEDMKLAH